MKTYWYELNFRGVSPGAMPRKGLIGSEHFHVNSRGKEFGAVVYDRKLSSQEISAYELTEIDTLRELYDYEVYSYNKK